MNQPRRKQPEWAQDQACRKAAIALAIQIIDTHVPALSGTTHVWNILRHIANVSDLDLLGCGKAFPTREDFLIAVQTYASAQRSARWDALGAVEKALEIMSAGAHINGGQGSYTLKYWLGIKNLPQWQQLERYMLSSEPESLLIEDARKAASIERSVRAIMSKSGLPRDAIIALGQPMLDRERLYSLSFLEVVDWAGQWQAGMLAKHPELKERKSIFTANPSKVRDETDPQGIDLPASVPEAVQALKKSIEALSDDEDTVEVVAVTDTDAKSNEPELVTNPFKPAARQSYLRLVLTGSGKTYTALRLASTLLDNPKIALLDVSGGNPGIYAGQFAFDVLTLKAYPMEQSVEAAVAAAAANGYAILIVDGLTEPLSGALLETITGFAGHVIATFRVPITEYVQTQFDVHGRLADNHRMTFIKARNVELQGASFLRPGRMVAALLANWLEIR